MESRAKVTISIQPRASAEPVGSAGGAGRTRRQLRRARQLLGDHPVFLPLILRATPLGASRRIERTTRLVVEGFPRSGNTYASVALRHALDLDRPGLLASHVHTPSQVKLAVRRGLPTVLVVREPAEAVASLLVAAPHVRPAAAMREWVHHHRVLLGVRDRIVVTTLAEVTNDLAGLVDRINQRFDCDFAIPAAAPAAEVVLATMTEQHRRVYGADLRMAPWPAAERSALRSQARRLVDHPSTAPWRRQADELYALFVTGSGD